MPLTAAALAALKAELQNDPSALGYAGKTPAVQAGMLTRLLDTGNTQGVSISPQQIALVLIRRGKWEAVKTAAGTLAAPGHADAFALVELAGLNTLQGDFSTGALKTLIDNLVAASVLAAADRAALGAVAAQAILQSRAQALGLGAVDQGDVESALAS